MCDDNGDTFIVTLHNVLLAPDLCDRLFSIITLMNLVHTCLFHKGYFTVYFRYKEKNEVTFPHSAQRKHALWGEIKKMSKTKKLAPRNKVALQFLHKRLGHRFTRSLMFGDTSNFWEDIGLRIDSDPFCTSFHISSVNKKARSKNPLKPKSLFKWVLCI